MKVTSILQFKKVPVITARPNDMVKHAADRLRMEKIAALVVMEGGTIRGIISEREIVDGLSRYGAQLLSMEIKDLMIDAATCTPETDIKRVMVIMTQRRTRHVPVVAEGRLLGIVSIGDVVKHRLQDLELEAGVMRDAYLASH